MKKKILRPRCKIAVKNLEPSHPAPIRFRCFTVQINFIERYFKIFASSQPSASNFKRFSWSQYHFFPHRSEKFTKQNTITDIFNYSYLYFYFKVNVSEIPFLLLGLLEPRYLQFVVSTPTNTVSMRTLSFIAIRIV